MKVGMWGVWCNPTNWGKLPIRSYPRSKRDADKSTMYISLHAFALSHLVYFCTLVVKLSPYRPLFLLPAMLATIYFFFWTNAYLATSPFAFHHMHKKCSWHTWKAIPKHPARLWLLWLLWKVVRVARVVHFPKQSNHSSRQYQNALRAVQPLSEPSGSFQSAS